MPGGANHARRHDPPAGHAARRRRDQGDQRRARRQPERGRPPEDSGKMPAPNQN